MPSKSARRVQLILLAYYGLLFRNEDAAVGARSPPEASSTLLRMQRLYLRQAPHDTALYDVLEVSPNATAAQIVKSYRKISRRLHPDKIHAGDGDGAGDGGDGDGDGDGDGNSKEQFERVRQAYEVLKDDRTRLPYHRHGLIDVQDAVLVLTGQGCNSQNDPLLLQELLRLMGYENIEAKTAAGWSLRQRHRSQNEKHEQRVWFLAANLIESLRPVVEGALDEAFLIDHVIQLCDRLKGLPLGAQILRCIGRAYRYSGRRVLRRQKNTKKSKASSAAIVPLEKLLDWQDRMRDTLRHAKHMATAAVAGGRVVLEECVVAKTKSQSQNLNTMSHDRFGDIPEGMDGTENCLSIDNDDFTATQQPPSVEEVKEMEQQKARKALLESLQVEALWKICKIDLDRTIREACDLILYGDYFYFPSHLMTAYNPAAQQQSDGWVGSSGIAVTADVGQMRTASLLVRMGDIMVKRSKDGTAWME